MRSGMRSGMRVVVAVLGCCLAGVCVWLGLLGGGVAALATGSTAGVSLGGALGGMPPISLGSLGVPGMEALDDHQVVADEGYARRVNPEAIVDRQLSRTEYEHLGSAAAAGLARRVFASAIEQPAGGMPSLPANDRVTGFATPHAAQLLLPGGKHAIVESLEPIAKQTGKKSFAAINLALTGSQGAYVPSSAGVDVQIPHELSAGVRVPEAGASMTAVDAQGKPLSGGQGAVEGAGVFYANVASDTDMVVKPTATGFQMDAMLRSVASPQQLYFKIGMPAGARLVQDHSNGAVLVEQGSRPIAAISKPFASDAAQTPVPVTTHVSGDTLEVSVAHRSGSYQYPIELDPEWKTTEDSRLGEQYEGIEGPTNWKFVSTPSGMFSGNTATALYYEPIAKYYSGDSAAFFYETQGDSEIYYVGTESTGDDAGSNTETSLSILPIPDYYWVNVDSNYSNVWGGSCANKESLKNPYCEGSKDQEFEKNRAVFQTSAYGEGASRGFLNTITKANVDIAQSTFPTINFNTTSSTLADGQPNALYGSSNWIGPQSGALEVQAEDKGLGIAWFEINSSTRGWGIKHEYLAEHKCSGVQCAPTLKKTSINEEGEILTYAPGLSNGEDTVETAVYNPLKMWSPLVKATLKVDSTPPYNVKLSGLAESGAEVSASPHQITVEATDGTAPTPSSGIKSITVSVDGREIGSPQGYCAPPGPCTGKGTWTIDGESLGTGEHTLEILATDNADNVSPKKVITFFVRNATPVALGPGKVDPVTGQFSLSASDAAITGAGGVSRTYLSRLPNAGAEGPLGPQWSLDFGMGQSLRLLPDGGAELAGASGGLTIFASNGKGGFEAPKGDGNLTLEAKEKEAGKGITEYVLKDPAAGTSTTFAQPAGSEAVTPTYFAQVGSEGSGGGEFRDGLGVAVDGKGDVWVSDTDNERIDEFNSHREFVAALGYGVSNGEEKLEVCTTSCRSGRPGTGPGQFDVPIGVAVDSEGNVWVANHQADDVDEFNEKLEYVGKFGADGSPAGFLEYPEGLAVDSKGDILVADAGLHRVDEFNRKREFVEAFGWGVSDGQEKFEICTSSCRAGLVGKGEGEFSQPRGIAVGAKGEVWVGDILLDRVQEFGEAKEYLGTFGTEGTGNGDFQYPSGVAVDANGDVWVSDYDNYRVEEFNAKREYLGKIATKSEYPTGVAADRDGNVWVLAGYSGSLQEWNHPDWLPVTTQGAGGTDIQTFTYRSVMVEGKPITEPIEELGPVPTGVSCGKNPAEGSQGELSARLAELKAGCRALSFYYSEKTTATGESSSTWGEYNGRLTSVEVTAFNPASSSKKMESVTVARYTYDNKGRLRAEWDPRISPSLKTTYGYDSEGHVTALTPPGQETWAFTYGTIAGDSSTGRLLKITRAPASAKLWNGEMPKNSEAPKLSGSAVVGLPVGVSNGTWSNEPVAYAYQWEDCNSSGGECTAILGAINANYTVASSDVGHKLVALVTAINGGGSVSVASAVSAVAATGSIAPKYSSWFGSEGTEEGKFKHPGGVAVDSKGNLWVLDHGNDRVEEFNEKGEYEKKEFGSAGGEVGELKEPDALTVDSKGNIWVADTANSRIEEFNEKGECLQAFGKVGTGNGELKGPEGIAIDSHGDVWVSDTYNDRIEEFNGKGEYLKTVGSGLIGEPENIAVGPGGNVWVADWTNNRLEEFTANGELIRDVGSSGTGNGQFKQPYGLTVDAYGNVWVADDSNSRVEEFNATGEYQTQFGSSGPEEGKLDFSYPVGLAVNPKGEIWVTDSGVNHIEKWTPSYVLGEYQNPGPGSTVEYRVPVSGAGAPYAMGTTELATWGQTKDLPKEATAIFPPDEPTGWPASGYTRATVLYRDEHARTTNVAVPSGGISTTEYNKLNEITRKLSADNRAAALKESSKSAEVAKNLSSESIYNGEETQLLETLGPEHKVRLANGSEVEERHHETFSYNEGAPSEEAHNLVTKTANWSESSAKEVLGEKHETHVSYAGQENLGWKLRKPTAVTMEANGHKVTAATTYEASTGNPIETSSDIASNAPVFAFKFGSEGTGEGQFRSPVGEAVDSSGDLWVVDSGNDRVEEFSSSGALIRKFGSEGAGGGQFKSPWGIAINRSTGNVYVSDVTNDRVQEFSSSGVFVRTFGFGVGNGKDEFETCTSSCEAGISGSGNGQFSKAQGIAIDSSGNVWVVDESNLRVEEFNSEGKYLSQFGVRAYEQGEEGSENGPSFYEPAGIAISDGDLYVAEHASDYVQEFSPSGVHLNQFGGKGTGSGQFEGAEGIAVDPLSGDLYVTDTGNGQVEEFSAAGVVMSAFGSKGTGSEQFKGPEGVAVNQAGEIYVADTENDRVQMWEPVPQAPVYTSQFGSKGSGADQFSSPEGAAIDAHGDVWVADFLNNRVDEFSSTGAFIEAIGFEVKTGGTDKFEICTTGCKAGVGVGQWTVLQADRRCYIRRRRVCLRLH